MKLFSSSSYQPFDSRAKILSNLTLTCFIISFGIAAYAQEWGRNTESNFVNEAIDVEVDAFNNNYVTGYFSGETSFDTNNVVPATVGLSDVYVEKFNASGDLIWRINFGGTYHDRPKDLAIDQSNNIYVTGEFYGTMNVGGIILTSVSGSKDIFLVKISPAGNVIWARSDGGANFETAFGVTTDLANNVIITGRYKGSSSIGGVPLVSTTNPTSGTPSYDMFVAKFNSAGTPLWTTGSTSIEDSRGLAVKTNSLNEIYITAQFSDTLTIGGQQINNATYNAGCLAKFNTSGQLLWLNRVLGAFVNTSDLDIDSFDNVVVIGDYQGNLTYDDGGVFTTMAASYSRNIYALKTTNDGLYIWATDLGSDSEVAALSISFDASNNVYVTGSFKCTFTEPSIPQPNYYHSSGFRDPYLWKVSSSGLYQYLKHFGGEYDDIGHGVALNTNNKPIICGSYTTDLVIPTSPALTYLTSIYNFDLIPGPFPLMVNLFGDGSSNSFITGAVNDLTQNLESAYPTTGNFYYQDTYSWQIIYDTVEFCGVEELYLLYNPSVPMNNFTQDYNFIWNNTDTTDIFYTFIPYDTSDFTITLESVDGCYTLVDTVVVISQELPSLPFMYTNSGAPVNNVFTSQPHLYGIFTFCDLPDSIAVFFNNLDPNMVSFTITTPTGAVITDTLPHFYSEPGTYNIEVVGANGCISEAQFIILINPTIDPYIVHEPNVDTITICYGTLIPFYLLDSTNNTTGNPAILPPYPAIYGSWQFLPLSGQSSAHSEITSQNGFIFQVSPYNSGLWVVNWTLTNECGTLEASDTVYFEVLQGSLPPIPISGDNALCPNGSAYLTVPSPPPNFVWNSYGTQNGINWISANGDSIQVTEAGLYALYYSFTDTITGCTLTGSSFYVLDEIQPPVVLTNPADGIICPDDSVLMYVQDSLAYVSFNWDGPPGTGLSSTASHIDSIQGQYFVTVTDTTGCTLTSLPVEIQEYSTPFIVIYSPDNVVCTGDTVDIEVIVYGNPVVNWTSPFASTSTALSVTDPGWYVVEVEQCGITTVDSIQIIDGNVADTLSFLDTLLCNNIDIELSVPTGATSYIWSTGQTNTNTISVDTAGSYWVTITNNYGCTGNSDTVEIVQGWNGGQLSISALDTVLCLGDSTELFASLTGNIQPQPIWTSPIQSTDTILMVYSPGWYVAEFSQCGYSAIDSIEIIDGNFNDSLSFIDDFICQGDSLAISTGTGYNGYVWSNGDTLTNSTYVSTAGPYWATLTNWFGCVVQTDTVNVTVGALPYIFAGNDSLVCFGDSVTLSASSNATWTWENPIVVDGVPFYQSLDTVEYIVSAIDSMGCENADSIVVTISPLPIVDAGPDTIVCIGQSIVLSGSGATTYVWSTGTTNNNNYQVNANETIYVIGTDIYGCQNSDSLIALTNPLPIITAGPDQEICFGDSVLLNANGAPILVWSTGTANNDYYAAPSSETAIVTGTDNNGCVSTDTIEIIVNALPPVDAGADTVICEGGTYMLNASGAITYIWSTGTPNGTEYPVSGSQTLYVSGTDGNGCVNSDSVQLTLEELPEVSFETNIQEGCAPLEVSFTNFSSSAVAYSCSWMFEGTTNATTCDTTWTFYESGSYDIILTVESVNGCIGSLTETGYINVEPPPVADFWASTNELEYGYNNVGFFNTSQNAVYYEWDFGDGSPIDTLENPSHTFFSDDYEYGNYQIMLIAYSPFMCSDTAYLDIRPNDELVIYVPNTFTPDGNEFNQFFGPVINDHYDVSNFSITIYNRWGEIIFESMDPAVMWDGTYHGTLVQDGTYVWKIAVKMRETGEAQVLQGHVNVLR